MDEKQLQFLFDQYGSKAGFADFAEFKGLMADSSARKVFFDNSNKDLGFKDYGEFESLLGFKKKDGGPALPSSPSLGLPSVSTEPPKRLTYTDINSKIEGLSKAQKDLRELESAPGFTPGGYSPNYAKVNNDAIAAANKNVAKAKADRDKIFSEYAGEISRPVEQLIESQDYTKFFTPSGNIDYAKAREHFQKVSRQFGGGPALVEHWVANLKMRGQGEIERKEVKPLFEQKLKELGLQKYADQEQYANSVYEGAFQKNKSQIDLLIQDRDQRVNGLLDQSKTKVDALTADFNQKAEGLNEMIKAGQIDEQSAKAQYDALRADYEKNVSGINSAYQSEVGKINRQVKQKYGRINQELETISKDKDFVMKSIPEADRKLIDKAYADARGRYLKEKEDATRVIDEASGYGGMFGRVLTSGFLTTMASIGDALSMGGHSNKLVDWMQNKRTSAEEMKTAEYSWSKDPLKRAITSSGQSLGASAPLLVPSIGLMAATGGSATGVVGSALLSYYGENKQNAGQVYRDVLEQTGDVALARDKGREYFEKTAKTMPLYFLGSLGDKVLYLGKGLKKAVAGFGLELAEEVPVEYIQSHAEAVTSQGYKGSLAQYIKENPELMLDIAVGTGVQAGAMKTVAAAFSKVSAVAPAPQTQTLADAIMTQGREFAARLVQTQFDQGLINEQKRDELFQSIGTIEANLAKLDELGVRGDAAKLHMALSQEMAELQANRKAEKDESVQAVLDSKINDLKTQMTGVLTGQTEYIVLGMPGDVNSKTMLASTFNALSQQEKDDVIRSAKTVTVVNNQELNQQLQDQKQALGNPEGAPEGAYETDATVQSQVEQQAGPAEGGVQERPGVDGGQQEVGQGAGQQGQAPVTQPDTGNRVLGGQEEVDLAGELRGELRQDFQPIIDRAAQSLQAANVQFEVLDDAEFTSRAGQSAEGAFMTVGNDGKILLNRQKMEQADPGVIIWHESAHPVMNIVRNTNKPLYDRMVTGLKQVAQKSPELQRAIEFGKQYGTKLREAGRGDAEAIALEDDESIVESIAMIAADDKLMASLPTSIKQTLIDFVNYVAKALGIKARVTNTASADFRRTAQQIATALKEGRDITEIVGAENVGRFETPSVQLRAEVQSDDNPVFFEQAKEFATKSSFANKIEFKNAIQKMLKSYIPTLRKKYGKSFDPSSYDQATFQYLSDTLTKESVNAIIAHPEAIGWYDDKTQSALAAISAVHPEIETDAEARGVFIAALAIMSNGNKVDKNFDYAEQQYRIFRDTGRFEPNGEYGAQQVGIKKSLQLLNGMLDSGLTMSDINNFLTSKYRAGDLKYRKSDGKLGNLVSGELADEQVFGAVILGPKIGNGFYMNLWGEFGQLTMDRWFMRTWGRLTGTLIQKDAEQLAGARKRLLSAKDAIAPGSSDYKVLTSIVGSPSKLSPVRLAEAIQKASADKVLREKLQSTKPLDELRKASNSLAKLESGEKEAPASGNERRFIRQVFEDVKSRLSSEHGIDITMADLQAVLWYPEKILYESFKADQSFEGASSGYTEDSAPDYFNSAKKLSLKLGATNESINQAVSERRRVSGVDSGRGRQVGGTVSGRTDQDVISAISDIKRMEESGKKSTVQFSIGNRQAIIDKAKADGTYLKAPNGQPTNLSEDQWTTVRTPEFKNWFGDWENDPENASKVVDKNGEPMVVYHGSDNDFDTFKYGEFGFHFGGKKAAKERGKTVKPYFLSSKKQLFFDYDLGDWNDLEMWKEYSWVFEEPEYAGFSSALNTSSTIDEFKSKMLELYDGIKYFNAIEGSLDEYSFMVFSPNQIKSATENIGTFSTEDARIQFSAGPRAESRVEFKLVAFVLRKKAEGHTDQQIASAIRSVMPGMTQQQVDNLVSNPEDFLFRAYPGISPMQFQNLLRRAQVKNIYRGNMPQNIAERFLSSMVPNEVLEKYYMQVKTKAQVRKDAINQFLTKNFDPAKGLPKWVMLLKEYSSGAKNLEIARAKSTLDRLAKTAREIGFTDWKTFSDALRNLNEEEAIMSGSTELALFDPATGMAMVPSSGERLQRPLTLLRLPLEIQPYVREMRNQIDGLTKKLITGGFVTPEQAVTLEMNLGEYTNRAYELYTQKGFQPKKEAFDAAVRFLADQEYRRLLTEYINNLSVAVRGQIGVMTGAGPIVAESGTGIPYAKLAEEAAQYAERRANDIINKKETPYFGGSGPTSRGLGILKQRQTIPQPIRALMGEYTDPGVVFMMTVAKQAELAATSDYLRQLRDQGLGTLFFEKNDQNRPATHSVPLASDKSATMEPLNGLYTTPEIAEAFEDAVNTRNAAVQLWMKIVGANRWFKTVGSIRTQFVNFESNLGFAVLNGLIFTKDGRPTWRSKSITEAREYVKGQYGPKEISEITEKAIKLGLVGQSIDINAIRKAFREDDMFEMALDVALTSEGVFKKKSISRIKPQAPFNKAYRMGDDFWKVYGYITERETVANGRYETSYDQLTDEQKEAVDKEAADRVKDTWPTYDRMFEAVRKLSQNVPILGNFTAFQAESIRVLMNSIRLMKKDLADPQMRQAGIRRALGISTYLGLRTSITTMSALAMGYGVSGVLGMLLNDDDEEDKKWAIKEVSPIFMRTGDLFIKQDKDKPHIYTVIDFLSIDPLGITQRSMNALTEGNENMDAGVGAAVAELFGGFLEREMTFKAVEDLTLNRNSSNGLKIYNEEDTLGEAVGKITKYLYKSLKPSSVGLVERALTNENKAFEAAAFVGFRPYEIDLHQSFNISLTRMRNSIDEISAEYTKIKFDPKISEEDKEQARLRAGEKKAEVIKKYNRLYTTLIKLGASQEVLEEMVDEKKAVKPTGMDKKTKAGILEGGVDPTTLY